MAQLIGGFCASHAPGQVVRLAVGGAAGARFIAALHLAAERLRALKPDILIVCSGEHFTNFPPNGLPQIAIGVGDAHIGPIEPWMGMDRRNIPGAGALARHIASDLLGAGFDPTTSTDLLLDHGVTTCYSAIDPAMAMPIIPILQNTLVSPMMPLARCYALGAAIRDAIASFPGNGRVAILGTGGLSHWIGTSRDGDIDQEFDRWVLARFVEKDIESILAVPDSELDHAGTGAHEVRSWLVAAGALRDVPPEILGYEPIPAWIAGMGVLDLMP